MWRRAATAAVVGIALAVVLGIAAACAYWRTTGSGSGSGGGSAPSTVTVLGAAATPGSSLAPGGTADLVLQFTNPNSYAVTLTGITQNGSVTSVGGASCTGATSGVSVPTRTGLSAAVASGATVTVDIASGASMAATSVSGCQGASFRIPVTVTLQK
ncbi:MAG TPA: hypothetical protein VHD87_17300 [Acidimicrobiales bacterium]|nr:hypothetical protein [Acidimicrobiales bacterium]